MRLPIPRVVYLGWGVSNELEKQIITLIQKVNEYNVGIKNQLFTLNNSDSRQNGILIKSLISQNPAFYKLLHLTDLLEDNNDFISPTFLNNLLNTAYEPIECFKVEPYIDYCSKSYITNKL